MLVLSEGNWWLMGQFFNQRQILKLFYNLLQSQKKEMIEDLIIAAHNDAKEKLKLKTSEEIAKITGGIGLPPGFKFPL